MRPESSLTTPESGLLQARRAGSGRLKRQFPARSAKSRLTNSAPHEGRERSRGTSSDASVYTSRFPARDARRDPEEEASQRNEGDLSAPSGPAYLCSCNRGLRKGHLLAPRPPHSRISPRHSDPTFFSRLVQPGFGRIRHPWRTPTKLARTTDIRSAGHEFLLARATFRSCYSCGAWSQSRVYLALWT